MTDQDLQKLNRDVAAWLGLPESTNLILHPEELLRELVKREYWETFCWMLTDKSPSNIIVPPDLVKWALELVADQSGLLVRKVGEWPGLKEGRQKNG